MAHYIGIVGAIKEEIAGIKQRMRIEQTLHLDHASLYVGEWEKYSIVLVRTGIGREKARNALATACDRFPMVLILSIGYAGGLDTDLAVGDLVVADRVQLEALATGVRKPIKKFIPNALVNQAMLLSCPEGATLYRGGLLTTDHVVSTPEEKQKLGKDTNTIAVEMETLDLVQEAHERALPFLSVRSITDTATQELVDFSNLVEEDGEVSKLKAGWHVLTHPGDLKNMIELRDHAKKATANLTEFLSQYLKNYK